MRHCTLETGAVIFHEKFEGVTGLKDRYFIVLSNTPPEVECFTTTTQNHSETKPKLAGEFCEIAEGENCLPKRCFVDFRNVYRDSLVGCRSQSPAVRDPWLARLDAMLDGLEF